MPVPRLHRLRIEKFRRIQEPLELDLTTPRGEPLPTIVCCMADARSLPPGVGARNLPGAGQGGAS